MNHFAQAVDAMDAAVFSGDALSDAGNRELLWRLLERWRRQLAEWEEIVNRGAP